MLRLVQDVRRWSHHALRWVLENRYPLIIFLLPVIMETVFTAFGLGAAAMVLVFLASNSG